MLSQLFGSVSHSGFYSKYRPSPPQKVRELVFNFLKEKIPSNEWNTAIDVGCGTGQGTVHLANSFKKVYGFDTSDSQIEAAKQSPHPENVIYNIGNAEELPMINAESIQLITASSAAHWFNLENFFTEAKRILSVNGVVALIGYPLFPKITNPKNPNDNRLTEFYGKIKRNPLFSHYREMKKNSSDKNYKDFAEYFPNNFTFMYDDNIEKTFNDNAQYLIGLIKASFTFNALIKNEPEKAKEMIENMEQNIREIINSDDLSNFQLTYTFNYYVLIGRKK